MSGHFIRNKLKMRAFFGHRMCTNPRRGPYHYRQPSRVFFRVVRGMMPHKTNRGKKAMSLLHCYDGMPPRFMHIRKFRAVTAYRHLRLDANRPFTRLGRLMIDFGWKHAPLIAALEKKRKNKQKATFRVQKEIFTLKKQAIRNVAQRMKDKYAFLTRYEWNLPVDTENKA